MHLRWYAGVSTWFMSIYGCRCWFLALEKYVISTKTNRSDGRVQNERTQNERKKIYGRTEVEEIGRDKKSNRM